MSWVQKNKAKYEASLNLSKVLKKNKETVTVLSKILPERNKLFVLQVVERQEH